MPDNTNILEFYLATYRGQNPLDVALGIAKVEGLEISQSIDVDGGGIRLSVVMPVGTDVARMRERIFLALTPVHTGLIFVTDTNQPSPPTTPELPFYATIKVGAHLKVIRQGGVSVYTKPDLLVPWPNWVKPFGDTGMTLHIPYDPALDRKPPLGLLCVLKPGVSSAWPTGLWIAALGNDDLPNVEALP